MGLDKMWGGWRCRPCPLSIMLTLCHILHFASHWLVLDIPTSLAHAQGAKCMGLLHVQSWQQEQQQRERQVCESCRRMLTQDF
jgi:hypothetical protein